MWKVQLVEMLRSLGRRESYHSEVGLNAHTAAETDQPIALRCVRA